MVPNALFSQSMRVGPRMSSALWEANYAGKGKLLMPGSDLRKNKEFVAFLVLVSQRHHAQSCDAHKIVKDGGIC